MERVELHRFEEHGIGAQDSMAFRDAGRIRKRRTAFARLQECDVSSSASRLCQRVPSVFPGRAGVKRKGE